MLAKVKNVRVDLSAFNQRRARFIEQNRSKTKHTKKPIKIIINRFTLPDPTDDIGRKKELLEKIQLLIYLSVGIAVIIAVFVSNQQSFPQITNSVTVYIQNNPCTNPIENGPKHKTAPKCYDTNP